TRILSALRAVQRLPLDKDYTENLDRKDVPAALMRTEAALSRAVTFLREDALIPHSAVLPYELPLVVLARFFDAFPEPRKRSRILLRRWIWRGSLSGTLSGISSGLRQHVTAVVDDDEEASVQKILAVAPTDATSTKVAFEDFRLNAARSKLSV